MATTIDPTKGSVPSSAAATSAGMKAALEDRSKYIRTMAKDMAALSGAPAPVPTPATPAPSASTGREEETVEGVTLEKPEQPFFERLQSRAEKDGEEALALPSMKEAASIVGGEPSDADRAAERAAERAAVLERLHQKVEKSIAAPIQKDLYKAEVPAMIPRTEKSWPDVPTPPASITPIAAPAPAPAPAPAKIVAPPPAPVPPPMPKPVVPAPALKAPVSAWSNMPAAAPDFAPFSEPVVSRMPPVGKESYREPIEAKATPAPESFHTYTSDFANRIDKQGSSAFSVLAAEQDADVRVAPALAKRKGSPMKAVLAVGSGILLLALACGGIVVTYQFVMTVRDTPIAAVTVPSIVFADEYRKLEGTGATLMQGLVAARNAALVSGNVLITYILTSETGEGGGLVTTPAGGDAFLRALQVPAPDILLRNIAEESSVGVIDAGGTSVFFALRVDSYERTYAGMLTWEPLMARDLALAYPLYPAVEIPDPLMASSTATSTVAAATPRPAVSASARTRFEDAIVANHDVRKLMDTDGRTLVLYGYADKRTLLIVRDEAAFEALLGRLKAD